MHDAVRESDEDTGYDQHDRIWPGRSSPEDRRVTVEIKSVNNRYCDIQIRMPRILAALENRVREEIGRQVSRGKIDVFDQL